MKLSKADMEFAHDTIHMALEYASDEGFSEESGWEEANATLEAAGLSKDEIKEAGDSYISA